MQNVFYSFTIFFLITFSGFAQNDFEFIQLNKEKYELSAICSDNHGNIIVASDEGSIDYIDLKNYKLKPIDHKIIGKDIEALDFFNGKIWYAIEENYRKIEFLDLKSTSPYQPISSTNLNGIISSLIPNKDNSSIEAFAIDSINSKLYFSKEYNKRAIYFYNLNNLRDQNWNSDEVRILDIYRGKDESPLDISDMKISYNDKGQPILYILERYERQIRMYNITTQKTKTVSFKKIVCDTDSSLFYNKQCDSCTCYGKAEALLVKKDEFWIGFDNGGYKINENFVKKYGYNISHKTNPVILKIKRYQP
ncbi:hypothetical protein [Flavivirga spongiicola]|uniref:Uncharacterized protein n=1 Tax=Flavivirga spongiicola TaxID=421621 RepID=A0ABU7XLF3_9FLAO|nr:hypothetical protein [Flavivirga sp. MEBiC05379]MDO5981251.1 hypothetical protein [Flavivirga sp. MEBiC05379]